MADQYPRIPMMGLMVLCLPPRPFAEPNIWQGFAMFYFQIGNFFVLWMRQINN